MSYKSFIQKWIPKKLEPRFRLYFCFFRGLWFSGRTLYCPCCNTRSRRFLPGGTDARPGVQCPRCGSLERHRLLWLYLKQNTDFFQTPKRVLDIAPSYFQQQRMRQFSHLDYTSADLAQSWVTVHCDLTKLPFPDNHFDCILCYHVLEHIPEDRRAMKELYRVLRTGGWAILQSPVDRNRETTYEDENITNPRDRRREFGQEDHVRVYGRDYAARLAEAGFLVTVDPFAQSLPSETIRMCRLIADECMYIGKKTIS
jgi:SAM-dependent methyltransferase